MSNTNSNSNDILVEVRNNVLSLLRVCMHTNSAGSERMTRVCYVFFTRPIKRTNCQKKKTG